MNPTDLLKVLSAMQAELKELESEKSQLWADMPKNWWEELNRINNRAVIVRFTYEDLFRLYKDILTSVSFVTPTL